MKNKRGEFCTAKLQVIIAIAMITVIGFSFAACNNDVSGGGGGGGPRDTRDPKEYTGTTLDGLKYTLKIEDGSARAVLTPRANDKYTLTAGAKTSTGIVVSFINNVFILKPSAGTTFTVVISESGGIIELKGTEEGTVITWTDKTATKAPGAVAPGDGSFKLNFRVVRFELDGNPAINSSTGVALRLKDYFGGTLKKGTYYTVKISGNLDKAIDLLTLMFYFNQDGPWHDNDVGDWDSWDTITAQIPAGQFSRSFKILIRDDITIKKDWDIIVHLAYDGDFGNLPDDTVTATISNFKMTINEFVDETAPGEGAEPGNGNEGGNGDPGTNPAGGGNGSPGGGNNKG